MNLHNSHTVSGFLILFFLAGKISLHYYLDLRRNESSSFMYAPLEYLKPYKKAVDPDLFKIKRLCNFFFLLALIALLLNLTLGIAIYAGKT